MSIDRAPMEAFTRSDFARLGLTEQQVRDAVDARQVRRVLRGVYVRSEVPDTIHSRVRAARLVVSPWSVVRDRTAAWIWDVDVFAWHETEVLPPIELCVWRHHEPTRRAGVAGGTRDLRSEDVVQIEGLWVTTPLRTALDLACVLSPRDALAAVDELMRRHGVSTSDLRRTLPRYFRRRGVVQARRVVPLGDPRSESPGESWVRYEILTRGLPPPVPQLWVGPSWKPALFRLDLAYPRHRVAVEYDGAEFHTDPVARARDEERRSWLRDNGWIVIVVDQTMLSDDATDRWIAQIRTALASRTYRPS